MLSSIFIGLTYFFGFAAILFTVDSKNGAAIWMLFLMFVSYLFGAISPPSKDRGDEDDWWH